MSIYDEFKRIDENKFGKEVDVTDLFTKPLLEKTNEIKEHKKALEKYHALKNKRAFELYKEYIEDPKKNNTAFHKKAYHKMIKLVIEQNMCPYCTKEGDEHEFETVQFCPYCGKRIRYGNFKGFEQSKLTEIENTLRKYKEENGVFE